MTGPLSSAAEPSILVTDFDGTLTAKDFYRLVMERLIPAGTPDYWSQYRAGAITHFDALRLTFEAAEGGEEALLDLTRSMGLVPSLAEDLESLRLAGWSVVVVSAGCSWYIDRLLEAASVSLQVFANPGRVLDGRLRMERPAGSPFYSEETGIEKSAVVREALRGGRRVAFAGDGPPDLPPALLVAPDLRFARRAGDLADALDARGEPYRAFRSWHEVAQTLSAMGTP